MPSIAVELLFESSSSAKYNHQGLLHGTRKMLAEYEQNIVYPKDREQYHKCADPEIPSCSASRRALTAS